MYINFVKSYIKYHINESHYNPCKIILQNNNSYLCPYRIN